MQASSINPTEEEDLVIALLSVTACAGATPVREDKGEEQKPPKRAKFRSSWTARDKGAKADDKNDFLSELGNANYNINVHHGMQLCVIPSCPLPSHTTPCNKHPKVPTPWQSCQAVQGGLLTSVPLCKAANTPTCCWQVRTARRWTLYTPGTFWAKSPILLTAACEAGSSENLTTWLGTTILLRHFLKKLRCAHQQLVCL